MGLQLSTESQEPAPAHENSPLQGNTDIELAHVSVNINDSLQRGDRDEHTYGVAGAAASQNAGEVRRSSEVTLSRSVIVLVVVGMILISTVISIISGVVVYHVTNGKNTEKSQEMSSSTNITDALTMDINSLKDEVNKLSNNQSESRDYLETVNNVVQIVQMKQNSSDIVSRDNNRRLQTLNNTLLEVQEHQKYSGRQVAFTVHSPTGTLVDMTPIFLHIVMNEGGAYNTSTGRFTCPIQGVYLFTLSLLTVGTRSSSVYCNVYQNTTHVTQAWSNEGVHDSASITTFIHLSVGDVVFLSCVNWQNVNKYLNTLYSGSLIRAD